MLVKMRSIALTAAVLSGFAATQNLGATCSSTVIQYQASGQFGANVISGDDKLKLAGEPFSISLFACESSKPTKTGSDYSEYYPIELEGQVKSALLVTPYQIKPTPVAFILVEPTTGVDAAEMEGPITIEGSTITIKGDLSLPAGTLTSQSIAPFASVTIDTAKSVFTYSEGTESTSLSVIGKASATVYTPTTVRDKLALYPDAVQVITVHADGTQSARALQMAPLDPGASPDKLMLQFYASGVRDASQVRVQIAGQDVAVRYAGASGHFPGLDEVTVEVPRSLAGMGDADVVLTADGEAAGAVRIHIQ